MNQIVLILLAFIGGVFLAVQGGFNTQLSVFLKSPILASTVVFIGSAAFACVAFLISLKSIPSTDQLKAIPWYLWFVGALFSVAGISLYYYTIPRLGISTMISLGLSGQVFISLIAAHFGWFGLPVEPMDIKRLSGSVAMLIGIFLINK